MSWPIVHKFGGTSLADAEAIARSVSLVCRWGEGPQAVVVSAMGGVTDTLLGLIEAASRRAGIDSTVEALVERHATAASSLDLPLPEIITRTRADLADLLHAVRLVGSADATLRDVVAGYGERWSAALFAAALAQQGRQVRVLDAATFLIARDDDMGPVVDWPASSELLAAQLPSPDHDLVVPGYVASYPDGRPRTLGRNGSDFSAAILARLLRAQTLRIWTDVPGVMSADPRLVPEARVLETLSYDEALELAYFGAGVLHPRTIAPAMEAGIDIHIGDGRHPDAPGTRIARDSRTSFAIKGITAIPAMALVTLTGAGLIGVPGTARRLFSCLERVGISVVMISQASSEHSICCAVPQASAQAAVETIQVEYATELAAGQVQGVSCDADAAVLAVVGSAMRGQPGVAARFFGALARCGINVKAIAQGGSERNITAAVAGDEAARAVRAVHAAFYLSPQTVSIGLIGTGHVGRALLDQLQEQAPRLEERFSLRIRAVADSRRMMLGEAIDRQPGEGDPAADLDALVDHVAAEHLPHAVLIDCTADDGIAERHADWLARGIHVVTPNKKGIAGGLDRYRRIREAARASGARYGCETTVGAGLPVIHTLRDLIDTGDRVIEIEGMLSGTLAWLFHGYDGSTSFAELVREAWQAGYTEPDPRDDLSGLDVARKLVILARELGLALEIANVPVESLIPDGLADGDVEAFLAALRAHDDAMAQRVRDARAEGGVLRFVARLDAGGQAAVGLTTVPLDHPFAQARTTDNVVRFRTRRYDANPLVVQGPGAGPEVTAAGVFADLLRLGAGLGGG